MIYEDDYNEGYLAGQYDAMSASLVSYVWYIDYPERGDMTNEDYSYCVGYTDGHNHFIATLEARKDKRRGEKS